MSAGMTLRGDEQVELGEMLEFLADWIDADADTLGWSLDRFTGGSYLLDELRGELARFVFLLGGASDRFVHGSRP
jgi:hypothetical protein